MSLIDTQMFFSNSIAIFSNKILNISSQKKRSSHNKQKNSIFPCPKNPTNWIFILLQLT